MSEFGNIAEQMNGYCCCHPGKRPAKLCGAKDVDLIIITDPGSDLVAFAVIGGGHRVSGGGTTGTPGTPSPINQDLILHTMQLILSIKNIYPPNVLILRSVLQQIDNRR